jgi:hypothetical protein
MSSPSVWRFASASEVGAAHQRLAIPCQDATWCEVVDHDGDGPVLIAVVADGAGSAGRSDVGAQLACRVAGRAIGEHLGGLAAVAGLDRDFAGSLLETVRDELGAQAARDGGEVRDYACTLLAAVVGGAGAAFLQVGDGAIVVRAPGDDEEYSWVFWPENLEYANVTVFVTDAHAPRHLCFATVNVALAELALFSDGLQRLALDFAARRAHPPFFRSLLAAVRQAPAAAVDTLQPALGEFLRSPRVNERTDDDKSLVLAVRLPLDPPPA